MTECRERYSIGHQKEHAESGTDAAYSIASPQPSAIKEDSRVPFLSSFVLPLVVRGLTIRVVGDLPAGRPARRAMPLYATGRKETL